MRFCPSLISQQVIIQLSIRHCSTIIPCFFTFLNPCCFSILCKNSDKEWHCFCRELRTSLLNELLFVYRSSDKEWLSNLSTRPLGHLHSVHIAVIRFVNWNIL